MIGGVHSLRLMQRRDFLRTSGRAMVGLPFLPSLVRGQATAKTALTGTALAKSVADDATRMLPGLLKANVLPGLSIAVIVDGKLAWDHAVGVKDSASGEPVDRDTVFEAASVSKTVFAYAVMKLAEKGVIDLDTPLTRYMPAPLLTDDPRVHRITARQVLSHSTGLQDWRSSKEPLKFHFAPGEGFLYSGEGYFFLQSVVTHLTGRVNREISAKYEADFEVHASDIDEYLTRTLLRPFGMNASGYVWRADFERSAARPHTVEGKPLAKGKPTAPDAARYASAGGLHTTAIDYAKFMLEVINARDSDEFRLSRTTVEKMLRPQSKLGEQEIDGARAWALGWAVQERKTGNVIVHSGGQPGFRSLAMASMERKSGFVMLTNGDNGGKVIYDRALGDVLNRLLPA